MTGQQQKSGVRVEKPGRPEFPSRSVSAFTSHLEGPRPRTNAEAVNAGLEFVMSMRRDAHWSDFNVPSGELDVWVTAYVATRLGEIPSDYITFAMRQEIEESLGWLTNNVRSDGGWGCHSRSESDAHSTAWAVLALRRHGCEVPSGAIEFIQRCRRPDGGIALYPHDSSVKGPQLSAPDVTAVAVNALGGADEAAVSFLSAYWLQTNKPLPAARLSSQFYTCSAVLDWEPEKIPWPLLSKVCELMSFHDEENVF